MLDWLWFGLAGVFGALGRSVMGYVNTKPGTTFNWKLFLSTTIPAISTAFVAGMYSNLPLTAHSIVAVIFAAAGIGAAQSATGLKLK